MQDHNWAGEDLFGPVLKLKMSFLYPTDPLKGGDGARLRVSINQQMVDLRIGRWIAFILSIDPA